MAGRNEVNIDLVLRGEQQMVRGLKNVGDAADDAGDDFGGMAKDAGHLGRKIEDLRGELRGLLVEFDRTGDMDLVKKINAGNRDLARFTRLKRQLGELTSDFADAGTKAGMAFGDNLRGPAIAAVVGLGAVLTPVLGAMIGAAIIGGVGTGGIVGGIALAAKDPKVKAEAARVGEALAAAFTPLGAPFVQPVIDALKTLEGTGVDVAAALKQPFNDLAPLLRPLAEGLDGMADKAMPGFVTALEAAKPLLEILADELPEIGDALSDFFEAVSSNPEAAAAAFKNLLDVLEMAVRGTGEFIGAMEDAYEGILRFAGKVAPILEALYGWVPITGEKIKEGNRQIQETLATMDRVKAEGEELKALYASFPEAVSTYVEITGLKPTLDQLRELVALMRIAGAVVSGGVAGARVGARAGGGDVEAGGTYVVGERGPEVLQMGSSDGHVFSNAQSASMVGGTQTVVIDVRSGGNELDDLITKIIRTSVATIGGGNVQRTYGRDDR